LKNFLSEKLVEKVKNETMEISPPVAKNVLFFQPSLWYVDLEKFK